MAEPSIHVRRMAAEEMLEVLFPLTSMPSTPRRPFATKRNGKSRSGSGRASPTLPSLRMARLWPPSPAVP